MAWIATYTKGNTEMPTVSAQVLRNLGVPVQIAEVRQETEQTTRTKIVDGKPVEIQEWKIRWVPCLDSAGKNVVTRKTHIRMTNAAIAALEDGYGSMTAFQANLEGGKTNQALRDAFAAALGYRLDDPDDLAMVSAMLLPEETGTYAGALSVALAVANGVDPTAAALMLEEAARNAKATMAGIGEQIKAEAEKGQKEWEAVEALPPEVRLTLHEATMSEDWAAFMALTDEEKAGLADLVASETSSSRGKTGSKPGSGSAEEPTSSGD